MPRRVLRFLRTPRARAGLGIALLLEAFAVAAFVRMPYLLIEPGGASNVVPLLKVAGPPVYPPRGQLLYLTVTLTDRQTPLELLAARLRGDSEQVKERDILGTRSRGDNQRLQLAIMRSSKLVAEKVALQKLGYTVDTLRSGALVNAVAPGSPADGVVVAGDVVTAVDGRPTASSADVVNAVRARRPGDVVAFTVRREGVARDLTVRARSGPGGVAQVGIQLVDDVDYRFPFSMDIDTGQVGGPSAGLAFALAVIDELTPGELTGDHRVAVTGAIGADGTVEPVGGVAQKAAAAERAGARVFLVPRDEVAEARAHAGRMQVVGVATLDDALAALARYGGNGLALPRMGGG